MSQNHFLLVAPYIPCDTGYSKFARIFVAPKRTDRPAFYYIDRLRITCWNELNFLARRSVVCSCKGVLAICSPPVLRYIKKIWYSDVFWSNDERYWNIIESGLDRPIVTAIARRLRYFGKALGWKKFSIYKIPQQKSLINDIMVHQIDLRNLHRIDQYLNFFSLITFSAKLTLIW